MGIKVKGDEALKLLELLEKMDEDYVPTEEEWAYLESVEELDLSNKKISTLSESIGNLSNLQILNLSSTQISTLPESIGNLTNLQEFYLSHAQITTLPKSIGNLSNLQTLVLSWTGISTLPESIGNLSNLQTLNLSGTPITLPDSIGNLSNLQKLDLSETFISTLPDSIGNLFNLKLLNLYDSQISVLPESIGNLANLQKLDLSFSIAQTIALPNSIGNLTNLQELSLYFTRTRTLPSSVGNLSNLQELNLSYTLISILPKSIGRLTKLHSINLSALHLQKIPKSVFDLGLDFYFKEYYEDGRGIDLYHTTLSTQPISLFHQPRELIQAYYDAPKVTINDAKVIFLGDGGVGKSRTIKRLLNGGEPGDYPTERTPGIEITDYPATYKGHPVDLRIWDFGGQEIMHAMHRCFLTDRTCYVVMVSNRFGNRTQRARYWLKTINSFAKNCPVILAVNLWDTDEGIDGVNGELLAEEFDNLKKIIPYSAKGSDKDHFNRLTEAIVEQANRLDSCGMEFPKRWEAIRADLSKRAETERYISKADYLSICAKNGETDLQICGWLLEWFNDLGVCFSYHTDKTSGQELEDYQVLDPKWLVNAVYLIINKGNHEGKIERRTRKNGTISLEHIQDLLEKGGGTAPEMRYTEQECGYILNVMRKFRLSYPNNEESEFIPALCPDQWKKAPQTVGWDSHVTYEMRYKYLPDSVLHRLMIYGKDKLKLEQAWSGGMELSNDKGRYHAVIYLRAEDSTLEINVYAKEDRKPWELLEDLRSELERINKDLNLDAEDVIVMKKNQQTAHFPVAAVLKAVERHIPTLYAMDGGELEEYRVNDILGAAFDMKKVEEEREKAKEENRPMSAGNISYENCTFHIGRDYNPQSDVKNYTSEDAKELLQQVLDHQERVTEQFMDTLLEVLRESREQPVQKLVAEVDTAPQKKKSRLEVMRDLLSDSSNLATVADVVVPKLPALWALAKVFLPGL